MRSCIITGLLSLWMDLTSGAINIQLIPQYPVIGESATLNVTGVTGKILSFAWFKGPKTAFDYEILVYLPASPVSLATGPLHISRARPFPDGSLLFSDLSIIDSDIYTVKILTDKQVEEASVTLAVYGACGCSAGLSAGGIAGIICGTVLGIVLIVSATFLLYKRCVLPVTEEQRGVS
ncbi:carcinoembryonic antigen-related cell adhesion molecule 16-like isoform X2 [Pseudophryne corroboree]|uniref:carcinoembryonic antigen-related cell adhesion molecule 16-like isoform X2 n=1 Tax=Pseudophryne corroboree TaxID=495146 RepID=UPI003081354B